MRRNIIFKKFWTTLVIVVITTVKIATCTIQKS
jgi:hypothetical protein